MSGGFRLTSTTEPTIESVYRFARLESNHKALPDIFLVTSEICVTQAVKNVFERFEPGLHQFFPIQLQRKNGTPFDGNYYLLNICTVLDSIIFDKSKFKWINTGNGRGYMQRESLVDYTTTVKGVIIKNHHLWREKLYMDEMYISDSVFDVFMKNKFKGIEKRSYIKLIEE